VAFLRMLMVALSFAFSRRSRHTLGAWDGMALYARECAAQIMAFAVLQPLSAMFAPRENTGGGDGTPVLLVHGLWCNAAVWWRYARWLRAAGIAPVCTVTLEPPLADIERLAQNLAVEIDRITLGSGAHRIAIVAHSMGGLVVRAYFRAYGTDRVSRLITLGSPHHGSTLAGLSFGRCVHQMRPRNPWLAELANEETGLARLSVVSFYSLHDNLVAPQTSSVLANVTNIPLSGVGHMEMLFRRDVFLRVLAEIRSAAQEPKPSGAIRVA
jgi:pimeloyl-ACP methyl ester carboxylesterase